MDAYLARERNARTATIEVSRNEHTAVSYTSVEVPSTPGTSPSWQRSHWHTRSSKRRTEPPIPELAGLTRPPSEAHEGVAGVAALVSTFASEAARFTASILRLT